MDVLRLVVTGAPGAGKSSFIRSISEIDAVDTDRTATDETSKFKRATTVAFDYGHVSIGHKLQLHLYGTPGQSRFNFMWNVLIQRAHAYVLLVAAHRPDDFGKAKEIITFMNERVKIPMVIGFTHLDCPNAYSPKQILLKLGYVGRHHPMVVPVDASDKTSINSALYLAVISQLLNQRQSHSHRATPLRSVPKPTEPPLYVPKPMRVTPAIATYF